MSSLYLKQCEDIHFKAKNIAIYTVYIIMEACGNDCEAFHFAFLISLISWEELSFKQTLYILKSFSTLSIVPWKAITLFQRQRDQWCKVTKYIYSCTTALKYNFNVISFNAALHCC